MVEPPLRFFGDRPRAAASRRLPPDPGCRAGSLPPSIASPAARAHLLRNVARGQAVEPAG